MNPPQEMERVVNGKRYSTSSATLLADDAYWNGHNHEHNGRNTFLYRTAAGRYFIVVLSMWQNERNTLTPISVNDAIELYEGPLLNHHVSYEQAFPAVAVKNA